MPKGNWKKREGIVFSTDPEFNYQNEDNSFQALKQKSTQDFRVWFQKRNGKPVTVVTGYQGNPDTLKDLAKELKIKCGVGGSVKNGEIIIQGSLQQKVFDMLIKKGYLAKKAGG